ncbi:MAG TPA: DNA methyltransferase [Armatimonadota bacterium]|nr:DNA methyltransferase [Armatimonadota bacterium]
MSSRSLPNPSIPTRSLAALPVNFWLVGQEGPVRQRGNRYTPASVSGHPGKMLPNLARRLIDEYTRPGDWILDPLSGIGTTGVEAVCRGRNYVGIELEARFVRWQRENLLRAATAGATGEFALYQADARRLDAAYGPNRKALKTTCGPVDAVLTSPPYAGRLRQQRNPSRVMRELIRQGEFGRDVLPGIYGRSEQNLGNLKHAEYLQQMRHVYAGCYQCLRPGGLLLVVLQPQWDRTRLRPLHHETTHLCEELGFQLLDELVAIGSRISVSTKERKDPGKKLQITAHASFWRRLRVAQLRETGWPVTLNQLEYVLVLRKPPLPGRLRRQARPPHKSGRQAALVGSCLSGD